MEKQSQTTSETYCLGIAETLWYSLWVVPNASASGTPAELVNILSSERLIVKHAIFNTHLNAGFFVANCDAWKYRYDHAKKIFQTACQGEIDLWSYAEEQKNAASAAAP